MRIATYVGNGAVHVGEAMIVPPSSGEVQIAVAYAGLAG